MWETTYTHVLSGPDPVFTWVSGTGARPTLQALPDDLRRRFEAEFKRRLAAAYPVRSDGTVLLPFRRVFAVAQRRVTIGMRLHHVQVACPRGGEADARRFYGEGLGMTEVDKPAELAGRGGAWFRAYDEDGAVTAELHVGVEEPFAPPARPTRPSSCPRAEALEEVAVRGWGGWATRWTAASGTPSPATCGSTCTTRPAIGWNCWPRPPADRRWVRNRPLDSTLYGRERPWPDVLLGGSDAGVTQADERRPPARHRS